MKYLYGKLLLVIQVISIVYWMQFQTVTDSYYVIYLICGILGLVSLYNNAVQKRCPESRRERVIITICAILFSAALFASNYFREARILEQESRISVLFDRIRILLDFLMMLAAGISIAWNTLLFLYHGIVSGAAAKDRAAGGRTAVLAGFSMAVICAVDMINLFFCSYPGNLSPDSRDQITMAITGEYSNHHPFWHTMIIRFWINAGKALFHDLNAGVALYSAVQIIFLAGCFTYAVITLYQMGVPERIAVVCVLWYALVPYNIIYSVTMWKDVPFGGAMLLLITGILRVLRKIGNCRAADYVLLSVGGLGVCLLRNNGLFAFILSLAAQLIIFRKSQRQLVICMMAVLAVSMVMKYPVQAAFHVEPTETCEALSVPIQQVAKVVSEGNELTDDQKELIGQLIDINNVPYENYIADPVKFAIERSGKDAYLTEHKQEYFKLWLQLGLRYPKDYFEAWVDQTRGYWNGGYQYWVWLDGVQENSYGIQRTVYSSGIRDVYLLYLWVFEHSPLLQPVISIGLHFWILAALAAFSFIRRRKQELFLTIPVISVILTLLLATPVYSEFRYAYGMFTCLPFILISTIHNMRRNTEGTGI